MSGSVSAPFGRAAALAVRRLPATRRVKGAVVPGVQRRNAMGGPIDQNKAHLFNRLPGGKREGWEGIMMMTYVTSAAVLLLGVGMGPETSIKQWARDEALARDIREARGEAVEYGRIYSQETQFFYEEGGEDDEDEDEEEEEEE